MPFDPDAYLGSSQAFNPDAYLAGASTPETQFNDAVANRPIYKGAILPFSRTAAGEDKFDMSAGLPGMIGRAFTAPGEALAGKFDPMSDEGISRAAETAGVMIPRPVGLGSKMIQTRPSVPTAEELKAASDAGYKQARAMGVEYSPEAVSHMANDTINALNHEGFIGEIAPKTHALVSKIANPPEGAVSASLSDLDNLRRRLQRLSGDGEETEAARRAVKAIDGFLDDGSGAVAAEGNAGTDVPRLSGTVGPSPAELAAQELVNARGNAAAAFRSDRVTGVEDAADLRAAAANSGKNIGNSLRQRLASLLQSDKQSRGLSQEEIDAAENIVRGTVGSNFARKLANLLGGGGGLGRELTAGAGAAAGAALGGGPVGAGIGAVALPAVGAVSKSVENALVRRQVQALDELIRTRSPLYQSMLKNAPSEVKTPTGKAALVRALMAVQPQDNSQ